MTLLYALPYDISASGFYFRTEDEYKQKSADNKNVEGFLVEEYEIQLIDGEALDAALFNALYVSQVNFTAFLSACEDWDDYQKIRTIIAVGEAGYSFDLQKDHPDQFEDIDIYEMETMRELAEHYVEEGLFGEIPDNLQFYLDYDAIARDLEVEYTLTTIAGQKLIYRCN